MTVAAQVIHSSIFAFAPWKSHSELWESTQCKFPWLEPHVQVSHMWFARAFQGFLWLNMAEESHTAHFHFQIIVRVSKHHLPTKVSWRGWVASFSVTFSSIPTTTTNRTKPNQIEGFQNPSLDNKYLKLFPQLGTST